MSQQSFLNALRLALKGMPLTQVDEIIADYTAYFHDAIAAGRSEHSICEGLGAPEDLATELRAESSIKKWEGNATPNNFMRMSAAMVGLGTVNTFVMIPLVIALLATVIALWLGACISLVVSAAMLLLQVTELNLSRYVVVDVGGAVVQSGPILTILGFGGVFMALVWLWVDIKLTRWLSSGLIHYVRLNYRVIKGVHR